MTSRGVEVERDERLVTGPRAGVIVVVSPTADDTDGPTDSLHMINLAEGKGGEGKVGFSC